MHHVHMDFSGTREEVGQKNITIGLGYEYHIDRQFNGVSVEVLGQKIGRLLFQGPQDWWVGGGMGWWPVRSVKVFMQAGALFVRVLEIRTPRHTLYDAVALGTDPNESGSPPTIQERAYTSPIWYTP
jgi:hypothetical protein